MYICIYIYIHICLLFGVTYRTTSNPGLQALGTLATEILDLDVKNRYMDMMAPKMSRARGAKGGCRARSPPLRIYIYIYMHIYTYIYMYIYIYTYIYIFIRMFVGPSFWCGTRWDIFTYMYIFIHIYIYKYLFTNHRTSVQ